MRGRTIRIDAKRWLYRTAAVLVSVLFALVLMEIVLRTVPIPGIGMSSRVFDPDIKLFKFAPGTSVIQTNVNGERIKRTVNDEGFLDVAHDRDKPASTYRIGFFGDSYVEALQVPLEQTFFRLVENNLAGRGVETLAFGKSGHGTFHSLLKSRKYAPYYDLDMVVYVFVGNDPGDHLEEIKRSALFPYAEVVDGELVTNDERLSRYRDNRSIKRLLQPVYNHSMLARTAYRRLELLKEHGIRVFAKESDFKMSGKADRDDPDEAPNQNDEPSSWPARLRERAEAVTGRILSTWHREVTSNGREFAVLYVPRPGQLKDGDEPDESWKQWLEAYCERTGIELIDPVPFFLEWKNAGKTLYDDHFTADGHAAFAESYIGWFRAGHP